MSMPFFLLSCSLFVLLRVLSFLLNLSSCIMFPFIHLFRGSAIFRFKKFKWTIQWHCRMNFTPYLTISFLSILSAQICINELNMTMYFFLVILFFFFYLCFRAYLPPHYVFFKCSSGSQKWREKQQQSTTL